MMYRNAYDLIQDILKLCEDDPKNKMNVLYGCRLNWEQLKGYVKICIDSGLLTQASSPPGVRKDSVHWITSEKGKKFINAHEVTRNLLK